LSALGLIARPRMPHLSIHGSNISFLDQGQGLPVLLLHGFPLSGESFRPQLEKLREKYRFIVPDHPGFGRSAPPPAGHALEMAQIARDALTLLTALGVDQAVVGGVSMGGYAAMAVLREDPSRVKGLVLIDTQPGADDEAGKQKRAETADAVMQDGMNVLVQSMLPKLLSSRASQGLRITVEAMIRQSSPLGAAAASRGMALRPDSKEVLARYAGPALVVVGKEDTITPPEKAKAMADLMSNAKLVELPGAGHLSNLEVPEQFNAELDAFLATIPA
jgi:pimeloyl-ACP methyl ester carboxylesterase